MSNREEVRENSRERKRSYLFLSMILLVWNLFETASWFFKNGSPDHPQPSAELSVPVISVPVPIQGNDAIPQTGPLSIRQRYLLGKQIDINKASVEELNSLPGISGAMAAAILEERERLGKFRSPNDLMQVKGIKEKRLEKILPFLKKIENN